MVSLDISETSKALAVVGGYVTLVGLVSYFLKEKLFMSEALLAMVAGIVFGPLCANIFNPLDWVGGNEESLDDLTFEITRIVIAIQVLFTGIALPKAYLRREWMSLTTLLGPIMLCAWFITSLLIWGLIPGMTYLESLVIGACVTPTDPVLANSICKGRFAEKHVPLHVRNIIVAESGANDGLGFPFLFIGLYLIIIKEPNQSINTVGGAVGEWFYNIVLYQICLSVIIGGIVGYVARKILRFAEEKNLIDHESFLSFGVALTFFTLGVVGILGSDDILCCFIVGNSFTWDDWFRVQTEDHAFQDVIDQLLSSGIFLYIGAIIPWSHFGEWYGISSPWRLVVLGILVMLVRRLPWVVLFSKFIPALPTWREATFAGFFGPIGVGAVFYTQVALQYIPDSRGELRNVVTPVVYFLVMTSVVIHGITIPLGKGFQTARSLTRTRSNSGLSGSDSISRLPDAVALGGDELRRSVAAALSDGQANRDPSQDTSETDREMKPANATSGIRFAKRGQEASGTASPAPPTAKPSGILSRGHSTPKRTRDRDSSPASSHSSTRADPTEAQHQQGTRKRLGQAWIEGDHVVVESGDGEKVRVMSREAYQQAYFKDDHS